MKEENIKLNYIITNHKNSIPIILKIRNDSSDLMFFYRELIHTIVYYNPIHIRITSFNNDINNIDDNLKKKEIAIKFGECLTNLDFSDIEEQLEEFSKLIVKLLYYPFHEVGKSDLEIHNAEKGHLFCQKIAKEMRDILTLRKTDIETIGELYQILNTYYDRWKEILSSPWWKKMFRAAWEGIKIGVINQEYGFNLGDVLHSWEESYNLSDDDFVNLYTNTIQKFIESSFLFSRNMDIDFTSIEILYQEYQEIENSLLYKKIQMALVSGESISEIYSIWRTAQSNKLLEEFTYLPKHIIKELETKKLSNGSINNIKDMICIDSHI